MIGVNNINIFDYPAGTVESVQGVLTKQFHFVEKYLQLTEDYTLEFILSELGGIPDKSSEGYAIEYIKVLADAETITEENAGGNTYYYNGHNCSITVNYVGSYSGTKFDNNWIDIDGIWFLNPDVYPKVILNAPIITTVNINTEQYITKKWEGGILLNYSDIPISNAVGLNAVLIGLFECTGLDLVSNFFNIIEC